MVIDAKNNLNRPLTYSDSDGGEEKVLTVNILMCGQNAHNIEREQDEEKTSALRLAKNHA